MNVVDNLNSVKVINKPCMRSRCMHLLPRTTLHSDSEQLFLEIARSKFAFDPGGKLTGGSMQIGYKTLLLRVPVHITSTKYLMILLKETSTTKVQ